MLRARLRHYFYPHTPEQEAGLWSLIMAGLMIWRPFAFALQTLFNVYDIRISAELLGATMALFGGVLIGRQRVGRLVFVVLFSPALLYAVCLTWAFLQPSNVGALGSGYAVWCCIQAIREYAREATRREQGVR